MPFSFQWRKVDARHYSADLTANGVTTPDALTLRLADGKVIFKAEFRGEVWASDPAPYPDLKTAKGAAEFFLIQKVIALKT